MPSENGVVATVVEETLPPESVAPPTPGPKIVDLIRRANASGRPSISFEFFPAKTAAGVQNLLVRVESMVVMLDPTFVTLTWRSAFEDEELWLAIGSTVQRMFGVQCLMHLTCHLPVKDLRRILQRCRDAGIRNILALRGDPPIGSDRWTPVEGGLKNAVELVRLIREEHGDFFCIGVAGYPEAHVECWNNPNLPPSEKAKSLDRQRLLEKQKAGADFIISQFFFDVDNLLHWIRQCRAEGITLPILPGYLPIQAYKSFQKFTTWCKTKIPPNLSRDLAAIASDEAAVKSYGVNLAVQTCRRMLDEGVNSLHFYTMNLASAVTSILQGLDLAPKQRERNVFWRGRAHAGSQLVRSDSSEEVRPIFWAHRPTSYLARTADWDDYPNGRWGKSGSPAFGELTDYYLAFKRQKVDRKDLWGVPQSVQDVCKTFVRYLEGQTQLLPWCEEPLDAESSLIGQDLRLANEQGFLTINSQPRVNAAPSEDPVVGWGPPKGYVFQKAYVEFFVSPDNLYRLLEVMPSFPNLSYHAVNAEGEEHTNCKSTVNAVTWGVFPDREIIQPSVVESSSFGIWKDEAFELWLSHWSSAFDAEVPEEKKAKEVIQEIHDTWFLVNLVDNDYVDEASDIFAIFKKVILQNMSREDVEKQFKLLQTKNDELRASVKALQSLHKETEAELASTEKKLRLTEEENAKLKRRIRELEMRNSLN